MAFTIRGEMLCKPFFKSLAKLGKASQPKGNVMLTDKILENDNIIVTVPDYLLEENQEEPTQEEESLEEEENLEEEEEGNQEEEEENQEEPVIYVESNFDETNIITRK